MKKELLCTLGPSSMNTQVIKQLERLGVSLFRINLSHTKVDELSETIKYIQDRSYVPICLDTEGAQVRTADNIPIEIMLYENNIVNIVSDFVIGNYSEFNLNPRNIVDQIKIGDFISIDFNAAMGQVIEKDNNGVTLRILNSGLIGKNKAVTIKRNILMPALSEKDCKAISIGLDMGVHHFALSFASRASDVELVRELAGKDAYVISKIESLNGLANLVDIANASDALLIDRGDLSREVPIEKIPITQKKITERANKLQTKLFVATNLLESMVENPFPTRAEVNDIYNSLSLGADGLVLAAETAIGNYPVECAKMIVSVMHEFNRAESSHKEDFDIAPNDWLIAPHGGHLVIRNADKEDLRKLGKLKSIIVDSNTISDCNMIGTGVFSPIKGFMDLKTLESVLNNYRLPQGDVWTMPILLPIKSDLLKGFSIGETIELKSNNGETVALLELSEIFKYDLNQLAQNWFGTTSNNHPGVNRIKNLGDNFMAGTIKLVSKLTSQFEMTPEDCRFVFGIKGWRNVVAFHTRNVPHRVHEYIMLEALSTTNADGLFINPVLGNKKKGDFISSAIMKSHQVLIQSGVYPNGRSVLGSFSAYSRYAGPREAVFTAICRKNMGCDYFIVGRDHTGVGDYYQSDSSQQLFEKLGDIGIKPIYFETIAFNHKKKQYLPLDSSDDFEDISGTRFREALLSKIKVPEWLVRSSVQEVLLSMLDKGEEIFCD
jgi:ATP sulfurylase